MTTSVTPQAAQKLMHLLNTSQEEGGKLAALLTEEKEALERRDYSAYHTLIEAKKSQLINLEAIDRQRRELLAQLGFGADKEGFEQFLQQVPTPWRAKFQLLWDQLSTNINACRHLNEVNGRILHQSQQATEQLMNLLRGTGPNQTIYQRDGRKNSLIGNRTLALA